jgi:hypothetical protein
MHRSQVSSFSFSSGVLDRFPSSEIESDDIGPDTDLEPKDPNIPSVILEKNPRVNSGREKELDSQGHLAFSLPELMEFSES